MAATPTPDASAATDAFALWTGEGPVPAMLKGGVFAIGNFDGVHLGHKALLAEARALASDLGRQAALLTFEPHPRSVFRPEQPVFRLTTPQVRRQLLAELGIVRVAEARFDPAFASLTAEAFVQDILLGSFDMAGLVVGADFAFGRGRSGNAASLSAMLGAQGRPVRVVEPVKDGGGDIVSSSRIRQALEAGDISLANALLGHRWRVRAEVVHGDKRGRELGYPTANMLMRPDNRLRHGIYAVRLRIGGVWRAGVASFGRRPTFDDGAPRLESFVFDFSGDLYGQALDVEFAGWIRPELKFGSIGDLIAQMDRDSEMARRIVRESA